MFSQPVCLSSVASQGVRHERTEGLGAARPEAVFAAQLPRTLRPRIECSPPLRTRRIRLPLTHGQINSPPGHGYKVIPHIVMWCGCLATHVYGPVGDSDRRQRRGSGFGPADGNSKKGLLRSGGGRDTWDGANGGLSTDPVAATCFSHLYPCDKPLLLAKCRQGTATNDVGCHALSRSGHGDVSG